MSFFEPKFYGEYGATVCKTAGTLIRSPHSGVFNRILCLNATVFTSITGRFDGDDIAGLTIPANTIIYGAIESFQLTSGAVVAYKSRL
jgi:hypothetical protein